MFIPEPKWNGGHPLVLASKPQSWGDAKFANELSKGS